MQTTDRASITQQGYNAGSAVMRWLGKPAVDKTIAVVATLPFVYELYRRATAGSLNIPRACSALGLLIVIVTLLLRRAPERVTPNPLWWILAFVATYLPLAWTALAPAGKPVVPDIVTDVLAIVSLAIVLYARLSLGRNIGLVPAQRHIVTSGAYGQVRHPIYTGLFLGWTAFALRVYSPVSLAILLVVITLIVIKSVVEEGFLRHDAEYEAYMRRVKHRYVPGVI